ncbi:hypothetical protein LINGRAHAP2_LOCUS35411, partial [Linum grandiflorum]
RISTDLLRKFYRPTLNPLDDLHGPGSHHFPPICCLVDIQSM